MRIEEIVVALSHCGTRAEILEACYGRGMGADIPSHLLAPESFERRAQAWRDALLQIEAEDGDEETPRRDITPSQESSERAEPFDARAEGSALMEILFPGDLRMHFGRCLAVAKRSGHLLRIRLVLRPGLELEDFHTVPWELVFAQDDNLGLARSLQTTFVRSPATVTSSDRAPAEPPLRVLLVFPQPRGQVELDLGAEQESIRQRLSNLDSGVSVDLVPAPVTLEATMQAIHRFEPHVLHVGGHGSFDEQGAGCLDFCSADGSLDRIPGHVVGAALSQTVPTLTLIVLNACRTADRVGAASSPSESVAAAMIAAGHNAVVAMQAWIRDTTALTFSEMLYDRIAGGEPIDLAVNHARHRIYLAARGRPEWAVPVLALRSADGDVIRASGTPEPGETSIRRNILDRSRLIRAKTSEFIGRRFVFRAVDDFLDSPGGCLLLSGDPGIGKTTFMAELLRRRRYVHHFIEYGSPRARRREHALSNLCAQIINRYGLPYRNLPHDANQSSDCLLNLCEEALAGLEDHAKLVLLVDALDELDLEPGRTANVLDLPRDLPPNVFWLVSKRSDSDVPLRFDSGMHPLCEIRHDSPENLEDIADFVRRALARPGLDSYLRAHSLSSTDFVRKLVARSEGNFMYLHHVLVEIENGIYRDESMDNIPFGLTGYYEDHWRRLRALSGDDQWFELKVPVLSLVTAASRPISAGLIAGTLEMQGQESRIASALAEWSQFLHVSQASASSAKSYKLYHGSFHEFVRKKDVIEAERIRLEASRRSIVDFVMRSHRQNSDT